MAIEYSTPTPVNISDVPPVLRDNWRLRAVRFDMELSRVNIYIQSALMDGQTRTDLKNHYIVIDWADFERIAVTTESNFLEVFQNAIELIAKAKGILPSEASLV